MVGAVGLEPTSLAAADFKSAASANSATPPDFAHSVKPAHDTRFAEAAQQSLHRGGPEDGGVEAAIEATPKAAAIEATPRPQIHPFLRKKTSMPAVMAKDTKTTT